MNNKKMVSGLGVSKGYKLDFSRKEYTLSQDLTLIIDYGLHYYKSSLFI